MSRVELAVEKVRCLNETQAEALLEWLEIRENRHSLLRHLDAEIEAAWSNCAGVKGYRLPECMRKSGRGANRCAAAQMGEYYYSPEARKD